VVGRSVHQWRWVCPWVGGAVPGPGAVLGGATVGVSSVELGGELEVGAVVEVVVVVVVGVDDVVVVVDGLVVAGLPPPLPCANSSRPQMITAISAMTTTPHTPSTHGLRNQGLVSPAGSKDCLELPAKSEPPPSSGGVRATPRSYRGFLADKAVQGQGRS
jgi:hypothetical protein